MKPGVHSLAARLLLASAVLLPVFLGATGWYLERSHRLSIEAAQAERLHLQLLALLAQAEFEDGLKMPEQLLEPRLSQPNSGLYALISSGDGDLLWASASALTLNPAAVLAAGTRNSARFNGQVRVSLQVLWETGEGEDVPLRFTVLETTAPIEVEVAQYRRSLLLWLGGSALLLLGCQVVIMAWGLRPLRELAADIARIEAGEALLLQRPYPREIQIAAGRTAASRAGPAYHGRPGPQPEDTAGGDPDRGSRLVRLPRFDCGADRPHGRDSFLPVAESRGRRQPLVAAGCGGAGVAAPASQTAQGLCQAWPRPCAPLSSSAASAPTAGAKDRAWACRWQSTSPPAIVAV